MGSFQYALPRQVRSSERGDQEATDAGKEAARGEERVELKREREEGDEMNTTPVVAQRTGRSVSRSQVDADRSRSMSATRPAGTAQVRFVDIATAEGFHGRPMLHCAP